ncbi:hypothetical protein [Streptomyces sp. NPDC059455]|uniref:hypothetical protein n=1 Tax=Streptomyces sp. NPDC059455 TaxID=3346837 RepID=UPI0036AF7A93
MRGLTVLATVAAERITGHGGAGPEALAAGDGLAFVVATGIIATAVVLMAVLLPRTPAVTVTRGPS